MVTEKKSSQLVSFVRLREFGLEHLRDYYHRCPYHVCEYSLGVKQMWEEKYCYRFAEAADCLLCESQIDGEYFFYYPVPGESGNVEEALSVLEAYCIENEIPLQFAPVPEEAIPLLSLRYDGVSVQKERLWKDYLYSAAEIRNFAGKKFAGQRNHIRNFHTRYPDAIFRELTPDDSEKLNDFFKAIHRPEEILSEDVAWERNAALMMLQNGFCENYRMGCMEYQGMIIGAALAEKCGDCLVIHIEKALTAYEGVYPALFQSFVQYFGSDCETVNREDDAAQKGLRNSKMQYQPIGFVEKYTVTVQNPLHKLSTVPSLASSRLILNTLGKEDETAYFRLCTDRERNRYWGYDDLAGTEGKQPDGAFFIGVTQADFAKKTAINFAVRFKGQLIGEVILYHFNFRGEAELGVRILPEYAGQGFGSEAFNCVADWALYHLGIQTLRAKCFSENIPSLKMLQKNMKFEKEADGMCHFFRII